MKASGGLVCQGVIDGENGKNGYNTVAVPLYRRSSSELNDGNRPSGTLTYTFSTGKLTGPSSYFNGWSQNIPTASANTKLYVIMAVARSQSDTDDIAASDWSTPVEYVSDGLNSAPVFIYKRAESVSDKPANGAVYTFATGVLAGTLNGWSTNIPATDNNHYPCWVRQAMAVSRDTTDVINASEWSDATKLVEDGDDAVMYDIVFDTAWAKVDAEGYITARLEGKAYKIVGSARSPLIGATIRFGYILNDNETYADTTTNNDGSFSADTWFDGDLISDYAKGSNSIFAAIIIDSSVKCAKYVTIANKGDKGDTGRMYYIAGEFPKNAPYYRTDKLCPVVYFVTKWWYLDAASATASDIPSDSSNKWKELQNYGVVLTDAIFVKQFAQFGAAIITGDWLISCHGTIKGVAYGGSVENPDQYNNRAAYTYFDPVHPQGYDPFKLSVTNDEINKSYNTQWTKITNNFILDAGTYKFKIRCYVNSSDGMHLRLFYGDETGDGYYLQGVQNEEPVTYEIEKTFDSTRNDWNIRAGMNEDGECGYIESIEIEPVDTRFVPNYAVDLKTGKTYQSDAHIRGTITTIGPNSKVVMRDGIIEFFGSFDFPNIVLGVDADGCAILNFYDKNGRFKYGLGPEQIIETLSQAESMRLAYYDIDVGSNDCTSLSDSDVITIYQYTYKSVSPANSKCLFKYLAKISANVYGGYYVNNDDAQGRVFNGKIIKQDYDVPLRNENIYGGGIVIASSGARYGMVSYLSSMLDGTSYNELDYRGYNIMKDGDFNINHDGYVYRFITKDDNPIEAFYVDKSYYNENVGYNGVYSDKWYLNLCTDPANDDKLVDPIYWFNLTLISSNGTNLGTKTLYINRSKLKRLLQDAGYSL